MKTVALWQNPEKAIEDFELKYQDCLETFLNDHHLQPCTIMLANGEKVSSILVGCDRHGLLVVRRKTAERCIIRIAYVETISVR